jgi:hypothetical protein
MIVGAERYGLSCTCLKPLRMSNGRLENHFKGDLREKRGMGDQVGTVPVILILVLALSGKSFDPGD